MWLNQVKSFQVKHNFQEEIKLVGCLTGCQDLVSKNHLRSTGSNYIILRVSRQRFSIWRFQKDDKQTIEIDWLSLLLEVRTPYNYYTEFTVT